MMEIPELRLELWGEEYRLNLNVDIYQNGDNLCLTLMDAEDNTPFDRITTNLPDGATLLPYQAYLNVRGNEWLPEFIEKNELGHSTEKETTSGFNTYLLYEFDKEKLKELDPEGFSKYEAVLKGKEISRPMTGEVGRFMNESEDENPCLEDQFD